MVGNPYLAKQYRLLERLPVRAAGRDEIRTDRDPSPVRTKVSLSDVRMHGIEFDVDYSAKIRIWVARDSDIRALSASVARGMTWGKLIDSQSSFGHWRNWR